VRPAGIAAFALTVLLSAATGHAQVAPPVSDFVPPYEIMRTLRSAGFDPLAPPLREGATYVARATDYRGILMRVVLDARTGAIRDANRIIPGPGSSMQFGALPPYEEAPDILPPPNFAPGPSPAAATIFPPLPRPRPRELAAKPADNSAPALAPSDATGSVPPAVQVAAPVPLAPAPVKPAKIPPPLTINN
jgi:hypothetical protein